MSLTECQGLLANTTCVLLGGPVSRLGIWHPLPWVGLREGCDQKQESCVRGEGFSLAAQRYSPCSSLPIMVAFITSDFHSQEREGERKSGEGQRSGQLSSINLYFTPARSPRKRKYEGPGYRLGKGWDPTCSCLNSVMPFHRIRAWRVRGTVSWARLYSLWCQNYKVVQWRLSG